MITEDYVSFEIAKKLKEKGFNRMCVYAYCEKGGWNKYTQVHEPITHILRTDGNPFGTFYVGNNWNVKYERNKNKIRCSAPTIEDVLKWLREEKSIFIEVEYINQKACGCTIIVQSTGDLIAKWNWDRFQYANKNPLVGNTYEKAAIAGIEYVLENLI